MPHQNLKPITKGIILSGLFLFFCLFLTNVFAADTTAPTGSIKINNGAVFTNSVFVTLTLSATDTSSGLSQVKLSNNNFIWSYETLKTTKSYKAIKTWKLALGDGKKTVYVKYKDKAGNWSVTYKSSITLDTKAPVGKILINNSAATATTSAVTLNLSATDTGSGLWQMQFSNNGTTWSTPEAYTTTKSWTLTSGLGIKKAYVKFKDNAGNWSGVYSDSINLVNQAPQIGTITPLSGSIAVNTPVSFTTTYSDSNGYLDIKSAYFLINTSVNTAKCFYGYYDRSSNKFYLRNDANTAWIGGFASGLAKVIENSYVKLDCSKTTVLGSGNVLTVKWVVTFKTAFVGTKKTYLFVQDNANASTGWIQKGTWNIIASNKPPVISSILPEDNSTFLAGAKITIKTNATDPDNDPLQYRFSIGGTVKQSWSSANTYTWQTSLADKGAVGITCEVKDSNSNLILKTISTRIIDPTIQEALKKVADNYAKITDFSADMTLSSTLDAKPFGVTDYCRYYFKALNKEKTETYNDNTRKIKNDIIIINGTNMHLIDPIKKIKQTVDLLADAGISSSQFSQLDLYYNQTLFLSKNTVLRNYPSTDFNNMIISLDISPNEKNNIYDKLSILIDYNKGLITKFSIYRINQANTLELVQETAAVDFQKMPNGAWLPVKMAKNPNLTSGKLISTLVYSNLKNNQNLSDDVFDPEKQ